MAFVFDVDGVLSDPALKQVTRKENLEIIADLLKNDNLVCLNTGRSTDFVLSRIFSLLNNCVPDKDKLINLFASCEKGAVDIVFDNLGGYKILADKNFSVPVIIQDQTRVLVNDKYSHLAFYDETKLSMISVEMGDGVLIEDFSVGQKALDDDLEKILFDNSLTIDFEIDPSIISTDIQSKKVGKQLGVEKFIDWAAKNNREISNLIFFGDSHADLKMTVGAIQKNVPFQLVFVGDKKILNNINIDFPIIYTNNLYEAGVGEYFKK